MVRGNLSLGMGKGAREGQAKTREHVVQLHFDSCIQHRQNVVWITLASGVIKYSMYLFTLNKIKALMGI